MTTTESGIAHLLLKEEISEFLYQEAEMLDERNFAEWLDLLHDDIRYWMPMRRNVKSNEMDREFTRAGQDINWFDEGKETLERRVNQILTGVHWAEEPLSRIRHLITNVQLLNATPSSSEPPEVSMRCTVWGYRKRVQTETDFLIGKREDTLKKVNGSWKIAERKITLDQNVLLAKNLTFFF